MTTNTVTISVKVKNNLSSVTIPWSAMDGQTALETAYNQEKAAGRKFDFAVRFFGYSDGQYVGYLVIMLNGQFDSPGETQSYWDIKINGKEAQVGIDEYQVQAGDTLEFDFTIINAATPMSKVLKLKKSHYSSVN